MDLRQQLLTELARRRGGNPRYSLRAFARDLGTDHASLSQILRGRRPLSSPMIRRFGRRLGLGAADIADACTRQQAGAILRLARHRRLRPDSRWIATRTNLSLDAVNSALHHLIHQGRLRMESAERWTVIPYA